MSAFAGLLLGIAQSPDPHWILAMFALTPWIVASRSAHRFAEVSVLAFLFVAAYGSIVIPWVPSAWTNLGLTPTFAPLVTIGCSIFATLPVFLLTGITIRLTRGASDASAIAIPAISLALAERIYGDSALGIPWAQVGHSQVDSSGVAQLAVVGGVPLITLLVSSVNIALALCVESLTGPRLRLAASCIAAVGSLAAIGHPAAVLSLSPTVASPSVRVLIAQPDTARSERWSPELQALNFERFLSLVQRALREAGPAFDVVVGPENLITSRIDLDRALWVGVESDINLIDRPFVLGVVRSSTTEDRLRYRSSAVWVAPREGVIALTDKERAVPIVEAEPKTWIERHLVIWLNPKQSGAQVETVLGGSDLRGPFSVTPVLCWEVLFSGLVNRRRSPESRFILNLADDSWVESKSATSQLTDFARFRAIEQRLPLIRVAHGGLSVYVDRYGKVLDSLPMDQYAYAIVEVPAPSPATMVEKAGLVTLPLLAGLGVWSSWPALSRRCFPGRD